MTVSSVDTFSKVFPSKVRLLAGKARLVSDVPLITCPLTLRVCSPPSSKVRDFKVVTPSNALEPNVFTVLGISALSSDVF